MCNSNKKDILCSEKIKNKDKSAAVVIARKIQRINDNSK